MHQTDPVSISAVADSRLSARIRYGYAIGEFAIACHVAIISIYLPYYLTEVQHLSGALAGALILIPGLWNIVSDPLLGGISDRVRSRCRRRPFLLAGAILWGVSYTAMFSIPTSYTIVGKAAGFLVSCLAVNTGLSLYHVP